MATHSGIFAWRIPWTEEPGGLQSMSHRETQLSIKHYPISLRTMSSGFVHVAACARIFLPLLRLNGIPS